MLYRMLCVLKRREFKKKSLALSIADSFSKDDFIVEESKQEINKNKIK
jgi:hypothetical protein